MLASICISGVSFADPGVTNPHDDNRINNGSIVGDIIHLFGEVFIDLFLPNGHEVEHDNSFRIP
jgi:hypothetical protein